MERNTVTVTTGKNPKKAPKWSFLFFLSMRVTFTRPHKRQRTPPQQTRLNGMYTGKGLPRSLSLRNPSIELPQTAAQERMFHIFDPGRLFRHRECVTLPSNESYHHGNIPLDLSLLLRIAAGAWDVLVETGAIYVPHDLETFDPMGLVPFSQAEIPHPFFDHVDMTLTDHAKIRDNLHYLANTAYFFMTGCEVKPIHPEEFKLRNVLLGGHDRARFHYAVDFRAGSSLTALHPLEVNLIFWTILVQILEIGNDLPEEHLDRPENVVRAGMICFKHFFQEAMRTWAKQGRPLPFFLSRNELGALHYAQVDTHKAFDLGVWLKHMALPDDLPTRAKYERLERIVQDGKFPRERIVALSQLITSGAEMCLARAKSEADSYQMANQVLHQLNLQACLQPVQNPQETNTEWQPIELQLEELIGLDVSSVQS